MRRVIALLGFLLVADLVIPVLASAQETADHHDPGPPRLRASRLGER